MLAPTPAPPAQLGISAPAQVQVHPHAPKAIILSEAPRSALNALQGAAVTVKTSHLLPASLGLILQPVLPHAQLVLMATSVLWALPARPLAGPSVAQASSVIRLPMRRLVLRVATAPRLAALVKPMPVPLALQVSGAHLASVTQQAPTNVL